MKKLLALILAILIILGIWFALHHDASAPTSTIDSKTALTHPDPSNATFDIDDETVTLDHGKATTKNESGIAEETDLTDIIGYGDLNKDDKEDAAFFLVKTNAVSGMLSAYVGAYVSGLVTYKPTNIVPVGIQIVPQSVSIKDGIITVTYLDRKAGDPLAAEPTVLSTKSFSFSAFDNTIE